SWRASPLPVQREGRVRVLSTNYAACWTQTPHRNPRFLRRGEANQMPLFTRLESVCCREIFPDSECRLDREFASACDAGREQLDWWPPATNVFWPGRFRARR